MSRSPATGRLYLDAHWDGDTDEVAQLDALGTLGQVEVPDGVGQLRCRTIGNGEVIDAARAREVAWEEMSRLRGVDELSNGNIETYAECSIGCAGSLLLLAEFEGSVVIDVRFGINDMDGSVVL